MVCCSVFLPLHGTLGSSASLPSLAAVLSSSLSILSAVISLLPIYTICYSMALPLFLALPSSLLFLWLFCPSAFGYSLFLLLVLGVVSIFLSSVYTICCSVLPLYLRLFVLFSLLVCTAVLLSSLLRVAVLSLSLSTLFAVVSPSLCIWLFVLPLSLLSAHLAPLHHSFLSYSCFFLQSFSALVFSFICLVAELRILPGMYVCAIRAVRSTSLRFVC